MRRCAWRCLTPTVKRARSRTREGWITSPDGNLVWFGIPTRQPNQSDPYRRRGVQPIWNALSFEAQSGDDIEESIAAIC
jgi:hypothetical protein